jgi:pyruvate/2-oxoglutarate dehydrogenase complex dihydrolipoamide dehydrogenase (E3) component/uncharacterized membrane protein YdjX (TVP38/TMEM64 family)
MQKKLIVVALLGAVVVAFIVFDLGRYLSLDDLKSRQAGLAELYREQPLGVAAAFFAAYVAVTAASLPGAAIMTLAAGALFGVVAGTVIVSFASSAGATLAFLISRHVLGDWVRSRLGGRLAEIDKGLEKDGGFYLFTLRLVPLVPFFAINLLMGLTRMKAWTFYWVSQLGMLLGTVVYVNAGTQLGRVESLAGILSPALIGSFVLLGFFPLLARRLANAAQARRVYARWAHLKPRRFDRNLVVIGAGASGLVASYIAAAVKAQVTLVEAHKMGGDCLNYGCVPSKALIRTATLMREIRHAADLGLAGAQATVDFAQVMERVARVIREVEPHDSVERYTALGVDVQQGHARIVNPWTVEITRADGSTHSLTTRSIVVATGAAPVVPPLPGLREGGCLTSDTLWGLRELPRRLVVLGGGPIGCELAQCFARLGAEVTQVEMAPRLLLREDDDVAALAQAGLEADGVRVLAGHRAVRCEPQGTAGGGVLVVEGPAGPVHLPFDRLLCAVGRAARLQGFGLEELGIAVGRTVQTNEYLETIYPNILAAGDVAGPFQFTHTGAHQAWYAAVNALFGVLRKFKADYRVIPAATFIDPEVARVGLNEQEAREQGIAYEATRYDLADLDRAIADGTARGFVKVLTVPGRDRILGATIVGPHAGDLLAEYVLAMRHGIGLKKLLGTIHIYPTMAEANKYAAGQWQRSHQPVRLLAWVARWHAWLRG